MNINLKVMSWKLQKWLNQNTILARILDLWTFDINWTTNFKLIRKFKPFYLQSTLFCILNMAPVKKDSFRVNTVYSICSTVFNHALLKCHSTIHSRSYDWEKVVKNARSCQYHGAILFQWLSSFYALLLCHICTINP